MPLRKLYSPTDSSDGQEPLVDIVAVHGLNPLNADTAEHAYDTWRKPAGKSGRLWLKDDLPTVAPQARVLLYQYDSKLAWGGGKGRFFDKANDLLEALRLERKKDEHRPLIFLGHSLGGILVEQALVNARNNAFYLAILTSTTALAFFGTPHGGGNNLLVTLGSSVARITRMLHLKPSNDIAETLKSGSLFSDILSEQWRHQLENYYLVSFWEGVGDIVPKKSAVFGLAGHRENIVRLDAIHSEMCRFDESDHDQDILKIVTGNIEDLYEKAMQKRQFVNQLPSLGDESRRIIQDRDLDARLAALRN